MKEQLAKYIREQIIVTDEDIDKILSCFNKMKLEKNELLLSQGQTGQRLHFVVTGCLRIFFITEEGQEATRLIAFENNFASGLMSFLSSQPSMESIQALEKTELLYITKKDFDYLLTIIPAWEKFFRHYLEIAYVINTGRLMSFLTMDASTRYKQLLEQNPVIVQRLSNKIVASYLNISQETLSRLKLKV